jgi:Ca-activated chloride channel family protein
LLKQIESTIIVAKRLVFTKQSISFATKMTVFAICQQRKEDVMLECKNDYVSRMESQNVKSKEEFYASIGYTKEQSFVLSLFTYGNNDALLEILIEKYDVEIHGQMLFVDYVYKTLHDEMARNAVLEIVDSKRSETEKKSFGFPMFRKSVCSSVAKGKQIEAPGIVYDACFAPQSVGAERAVCDSLGACAEPCMSSPQMSPVDINDIRTDTYETFEENGFKSTLTSPTSTFRATNSTAAMSILLNNLANSRIEKEMVRTEELINFLDYKLEVPRSKTSRFAVTFEATSDGKDDKHRNNFLFFGIKGSPAVQNNKNIVYLLDVSGSMSGRTEITQKILFTFLSLMSRNDLFSLVTYSSEDAVVFNTMPLKRDSDVDTIIYTLFKHVKVFGCTNGSAGIEKAYKLAREGSMSSSTNRVIIITDGDLNFGITSNGGLERLISEKKKSGVYFSAIGTGMYNLKDDKLGVLAKNGNGNYFVVNNDFDIRKCLIGRYEELMYPIATDVKVQVEFNPKFVKYYKQIGYETRTLNHEDFRNDDVISEPFGSGAQAIALYEIDNNKESVNEYKYQTPVLSDSDEIATVSIRYKDIDTNEFAEESFVITKDMIKETENIKKAVECCRLADNLRHDTANANKYSDALLKLFRE